MFRCSLTAICLAILVLVAAQTTYSQQLPSSEQSRATEREAEWNAYAVPQSAFVRQTDSAQTVLFKVPSDWKRNPEKLSFSGPHGATLTVFVEKISDGIPLRDYVAAMLQPLRNFADSDALVIRRTTMAALEAREIMFETDADSAEVNRRIIWTTVSGPNAISFLLIVPITRTAEIEPSFKAIVQSLTLLDKTDYASFDELKSRTLGVDKPVRVDQVQAITAALASLDGPSRQSSIKRLTELFSGQADSVIDLVLDARPIVRAAAFEAISQSGNKSLKEFLFRGLDDREPSVAAQAARTIAANPDVLTLLRSHSLEWFKIQPLARVWPFLSTDKRIVVLKEIFARPPTPNRVRAPSNGSTRRSTRSRTPRGPRVTARATVLAPGAPPPPVAIQTMLTSDPSRQLNGLVLMRDSPVADFPIPFSRVVAWENDALTALALQIAQERNELLPAAELLKLLSEPSIAVRRLAVWSLGDSGTAANIKTLEDYANAQSTKPITADETDPNDSGTLLAEDIKLTVSKIRFREQVAAASGEAREQLIRERLKDDKLSEWIWYRYVRKNVELPGTSPERSAVTVSPLGENIFPRDVTYFAALPNPAMALENLSSAIDGLQLESARSQANLVLILSILREQLGQQLDAPAGGSPFSYSGIDTSGPIAMASWSSTGATPGMPSGERDALTLRVTDRARFERTLGVYQQKIGGFRSLSGYFSGASQLLTLLPAFLPLTAKAMLDGPVLRRQESILVRYSFEGGFDWQGHQIKVLDNREVDSKGHLSSDAVYFAYLGNAAVLAPDFESLRDVLARASNGEATLATNANFIRLKENPGDAIYLGNFRNLAVDSTTNEDPQKPAIIESGALKISNSTWENAYQLEFEKSDWLKPLKTFHPDELVAPRQLLPRNTIAYYFMKVDAIAGWKDWSNQLLTVEQRKALTSAWTLDLEKDVLPELDDECGIAVMGLPNILNNSWDVPWAAFCKLKGDKLSKALQAGTLLSGDASNSGVIQIKRKSGDLFVVAKYGFLVVSNNELAIAALDEKEKLVSSRDFSRSAKQAPPGLVAFGGYSLEAAVAAIGDSGSDVMKSQQSALVFSLTKAFHSPNFYATASSSSVQAKFSLSMDREGRFSVSELASLSKEYRLTYAQVEPRGVPIQNQERLSGLKLRIRANAAGEIDRIKEDVTSPFQKTEKVSEKQLELEVRPRKYEPKTSLQIPIKRADLALYLQPASDIRSEDKSVIEKARSIAGEERGAWQVARKLADWTYKNIKWKRVDYATAPQTLATLEADCLEFSQLYVAMARSLGLPARLVSGLAYSGAAFGGHAWVEVYVGEWVEVDPTWGTDFVEATHIRNSANGALLTYASLNLVQLEVLEAPRAVAEFQKDPRVLAEKLSQELPKGNSMALSSALDVAVMTDEHFGRGTWTSLSESEREAMTSAFRRLLLQIDAEFRKEGKAATPLRLLKVTKASNKAEAIFIQEGYNQPLNKFAFVKRDDAWYLSEILQVDTDFHVVAEILRPTIKTILERRQDKSARRQSTSDFVRVLLVMAKDSKASIVIADRALKDDPRNQGLRHLKAIALTRSEQNAEAIKMWHELVEEPKPFAPALLSLAGQSRYSDDKAEQKKAIEFYIRYGELEPDDPRTHVELASLYGTIGDDAQAESELRAALKSDPDNTGPYIQFATFLALRKRFEEAQSTIQEAEKKAGSEDDLFGDWMSDLYLVEDKTIPEEIAKRMPERLARSAIANLYLAYARLDDGNNIQAIAPLKKATALKADWSAPYAALARAYRALRNWTAALSAADTAIKIEEGNSDAHFNRACALARLGRISEALAALNKAVELDPALPDEIRDEADLKTLASRPEFKKLMAGQEEK